MRFLYLLSVWSHILAAAVWIGGMLFLALVLVPALRGRPERSELLTAVAMRFRPVAWAALGVLLVSGTLNLYARGLLGPRVLSADFWQSAYGSTVGFKLGFAALAITLSIVHDFSIGPKASRLLRDDPTSEATRQFCARARWMGRANIVVALAAVAFAVTLVRGPLMTD